VLLEHSRDSLETQECDGQEPELKVIQQKISGKIIRVVVNKSVSPWDKVVSVDVLEHQRIYA